MKVCIECGVERRDTQFSFVKRQGEEFSEDQQRQDICRVCNLGGLKGNELNKILKEVYRNYLLFREEHMRTGLDVITYDVESSPGSNEYQTVVISFSDLREGVSELAPRKKEAFYYHIICNMRQREVGKIMGCTTVTVGQYVDSAVMQLAKKYFPEEDTGTLT